MYLRGHVGYHVGYHVRHIHLHYNQKHSSNDLHSICSHICTLSVTAAASRAECSLIPHGRCSGWAHTVENLEDTLSVNHNFINEYNIGFVWAHMQQERGLADAAVLAEDAVRISGCECLAPCSLREVSPCCSTLLWQLRHMMHYVIERIHFRISFTSRNVRAILVYSFWSRSREVCMRTSVLVNKLNAPAPYIRMCQPQKLQLKLKFTG